MPAMVLTVPLRGGIETAGSTSPTSTSRYSSAMLQKAVPLRRRRSKGTIAGFASSGGDVVSTTDLSHNDKKGAAHGGGNAAMVVDNASSSDGIMNQPQHAGDTSTSGTPSAPQKPCHSARLALLCVSNAIHMGGRTQIDLCPPGKASEELLKILQDRRKKKKSYQMPLLRRSHSSQSRSTLSSSGSRIEESSTFDKVIGDAGMAEYDQAEEEYLNSLNLKQSEEKNNQSEDIQADASSGDEDMLDISNFNDDVSNGKNNDDEYSDANHGEQLYTLAPDSSAPTSGKIAFNLRKLKWFDAVTASDRAKARQYLRQELFNMKKKDVVALTKHLKKLQRREKRRLEIERGVRNSSEFKSDHKSDDDEDDDFTSDDLGIGKLPDEMTPSLSAALVLESLTLMPLESVEGMSKCYEGIVAAGTALLDVETEDSSTTERKKPSKSEIMSALIPLLTTTLEKASGETILALAKLRKMCGTKRYQRRFVQRIAPSLVRPPNAAMWCLRHQNEMEAILVATEMILDASFEIFSAGWYERGRTLLADSQRAESLKAAATQLKQLSTNQNPGSLMKGLSAVPGSQRRANRLIATTTQNKDISSSSTDVLAEWEVLAVDIQIRQSIANVFTSDWTRVTLTNAPPRDGESYTNQRTKTRGITAVKTKSIDNLNVDTSQTVESALAGSPSRALKNSANPMQESPTKENTSDFANVAPIPKDSYNEVNTTSNNEPSSPPLTPKQEITPILTIPSVGTPPRSPPGSNQQSSGFRSPKKKVSSTTPPLAQLPQFLDSPGGSVHSVSNPSSSGSIGAPLSPSNSSYSGRQESGHQRFSSNSSTASAASQSTYLRTLTSTAAERKRTVAACRALRAQITRFEEAFIKVHGRPPKGAVERAPLATTYAQYREWKRAIRADAACRIQALYRGAHIRWLLMKSDNPRIKQVVKKRAGRPGYSSTPRNPHPTFPLELRDNAPRHRVRDNSPEVSSYGVEVVIDPSNEGVNMPIPRRMSNEEHIQYSSGHHGRFSPRTEGSVSLSTLSSASTSLNEYSLADLQARKRDLKQQLKRYDMNFYQTHGRVPKKQEKEPIRHLYENYNALKNQITQLENNGSSIHQTPPSIRRNPIPSPMSISSHADTSLSNSLEDTPVIAPSRPRRPNHSQHNIGNNIPNGSSNPLGSGQELAALKTEKQNLHQMLRQYERDFFRMHNRQVASYTDIRPVASQYRRYKEIKRSISALQARGQS